MSDKLPREMRVAFNDAAVHVVRRAAPQIPKRTGRLAAALVPASTQRVGRVGYSSPTRVPYAGFIEFGGAVGRKKAVKRPYLRKGRYLYPAAEAEREPVLRTLERSLDDLIGRAGLA